MITTTTITTARIFIYRPSEFIPHRDLLHLIIVIIAAVIASFIIAAIETTLFVA
jgi:hypothetical protein